MLSVFRRHIKTCKNFNGGKRDERRTQNDCRCSINYDWQTPERPRERGKLHTRDWDTAMQMKARMEISGKTPVEEQSKTIAEAIANFEATMKAKKIADTTLHQYETFHGSLKEFATKKGFTLLSQLNVEQVNEFRNSWDCADITTVKRLERLKKFFKHCVRLKWISENPAADLENPDVEDSDAVPFSEEEVTAILKAVREHKGPNRQKLIVLTDLLLASGLRMSDAVTFRKSYISQDSNGYSFELRTKKTKERVYCPLSDEMAQAVLSLEGSDTPFWTGVCTVDHATQNWREPLKSAFKRAGIPATMRKPHRFRHTLAKRALEHPTHPLTMIQLSRVLGHKSALITDKYYNKFIPERDKAIDSSVRKLWSQGSTREVSAAK